MRIDWVDKLQHTLQATAFALAIAALQVGFEPERPFGPPAVYSLCISLLIWGTIDLGREVLPSARETGWPTGLQAVLLLVGGTVFGWIAGNALGDQLARAFNLVPPGVRLHPPHELRNSILITIAASAVAIYYFYSRNRSAYLERKVGEARRHADEARLKLLETQLEPHMLFNTLANLRVLIGIEPARAQVMLDHMIAYLRATLDASRAPVHTLRQEFDRLEDYLALMAIRMGPRLAYELQLPEALAQRRVPTLLLQPLVENAIKHGLEPQVAGGRLLVSAREDGGALVLDVLDSGVGPGTGDGNGFGLEQVRERLRTVYGPAATLQLQAAPPQGTRVTLTLPQETR